MGAPQPPTSSHRGNIQSISKRFEFELSVFCGRNVCSRGSGTVSALLYRCHSFRIDMEIAAVEPSLPPRPHGPRRLPPTFFEGRGIICAMHWLLLRMKGSDCSGFSWIVSIMVNGFSKCQSSCFIDLASQRGVQTHLDGILPVLPRRLSALHAHTENRGGNVDFTLRPLCDA